MRTYKDILKLTRGLLFALCLLALPFYLQAQEEVETESDEELITLSAFEVSEDAVRGYATTSSLSGSRIAVAITDIPASVITINERLIKDTAALELRDTFNLVSGVHHGNAGTGLQESNQISLRGYVTSGALRDGIQDLNFSDNGGFDYSMIERVEIVKGPAGALYGQHSAGGVVNIISKRPLPEPQTDLGFMYGSYNAWRVSVDHSNMIGSDSKFGYRIAGAWLDTDGPVGLADDAGTTRGTSYFINPSISYQFKSGMKVWLWGQVVEDNSKRTAHSALQFGTLDTSTDHPNGTGGIVYDFATDGTASVVTQNFNFSENKNIEFGLSHAFDIGNIDSNFRFVARTGNRKNTNDRTRANGGTVFIDLDGNQIPDGSPSIGRSSGTFEQVNGNLSRFGREGLRYNRGITDIDETVLSADWNLDFNIGGLRHRLLLYGQFQESSRMTENDDLRIRNAAAISPEISAQFNFETGIFKSSPDARCAAVGLDPCPQGIVEIWPNPPSGLGDLRPIIADNWDRSIDGGRDRDPTFLDREIFSFGIIDRVSLFEERLILVGGVRLDDDSSVSSTETSRDDPLEESVWSPKYGAVVKLYKGDNGEASLFYNSSETFVPEFGRDERLQFLDQVFPNRIISTDEVGLKLNLWGSRVVGTFSYFDNVESNVLISFFDEDGSITGETPNTYSVPTAFANTEGFEMDVALNPMPGLDMLVSYSTVDSLLEDGLPNHGVPENTFATVARYKFQNGPLKDFSLMWMYNHWGRSEMNRSSRFQIPKGDKHTAVLGYAWGNLALRFRIDNLENDPDAQPSTWWTGVGVTPEINYRLSMTYNFGGNKEGK